ncbi:MAG: hypothetical protein KKG95_07975 [Candidatus Omnitrophica bacterium]|nr:hypothetical protein [Candidatus Omnitrophota bacterium]
MATERLTVDEYEFKSTDDFRRPPEGEGWFFLSVTTVALNEPGTAENGTDVWFWARRKKQSPPACCRYEDCTCDADFCYSHLELLVAESRDKERKRCIAIVEREAADYEDDRFKTALMAVAIMLRTEP